MPQAGVFIFGLLACVVTAATFALHVFTASRRSHDLALVAASCISAVSGGALLLVLAWISWSCVGQEHGAKRMARSNGAFMSAILVSIATNAASVAALAYLFLVVYAKRRQGSRDSKNGLPATDGFLAGSSALVGLSILTQGVFLTLHRLVGRGQGDTLQNQQPERRERRYRLPRTNFKSIRYSETTRHAHRDTDSQATGIGLQRKTSQTTMSSEASSTAHSMPSTPSNPTAPSPVEKKRSVSLSLSSNTGIPRDLLEAGQTSSEEGPGGACASNLAFPTKTRLQFLETIPASPTTSLSSYHLVDLTPPPPIRHHSVSSYRRSRLTESASASTDLDDESNIHPLFRSGSPVPPPKATSGTRVVASADAGQIITPKSSYRSLRRPHSSSLSRPAGPVRSVSR